MRSLVKKLAKSGKRVVPDCKGTARRKRMLVVGEALCARETADALAGWMDMDVETAENDRLASILATMSLIEDKPYEAIFIDVPMPDTSGLAAARWLRRHGWFGPIVACGDAGGDDEARKRSLESGCDAFIDKPLSSEKVKAALEKERKKDAEPPTTVAKQRETPEHKAPANDAAVLKPRGRVLVAEDALCMQAIVGSFLQGMELEADMAENGKVACDMAMRSLAAGYPYDVILMDIQMPKMNGQQAVEWLRKNNWKGPIIAFSSHAAPKDHAAFLAAGCNGCLAKPLTKEMLCSALSQYVRC
ncbi:MAG: response regulator [Thermoguttaceae bacterium]|jgi:two-component system sensor histidine kinase/response regulator